MTRQFDRAIASLDRALSEIMIEAKLTQDEADTATLRHHAGDMILAGVAILRKQGKLGDLKELIAAHDLRPAGYLEGELVAYRLNGVEGPLSSGRAIAIVNAMLGKE